MGTRVAAGFAPLAGENFSSTVHVICQLSVSSQQQGLSLGFTPCPFLLFDAFPPIGLTKRALPA
jgi:hypothetical protein